MDVFINHSPYRSCLNENTNFDRMIQDNNYIFREVAQRLGDDNDSDFIADDREGDDRGESPTIARPIVTNW